jgi:hypothetical protein
LRGLQHNDEWDGALVFPGVSIDFKLRHQSDEYSPAVEPDLALNLFHIETAFHVSSPVCAYRFSQSICVDPKPLVANARYREVSGDLVHAALVRAGDNEVA